MCKRNVGDAERKRFYRDGWRSCSFLFKRKFHMDGLQKGAPVLDLIAMPLRIAAMNILSSYELPTFQISFERWQSGTKLGERLDSQLQSYPGHGKFLSIELARADSRAGGRLVQRAPTDQARSSRFRKSRRRSNPVRCHQEQVSFAATSL